MQQNTEIVKKVKEITVMSKQKIDPRVLRTRKLIMDSFTFTLLSNKKDFKDITINDITELATINRATFYHHFEDKYELFETLVKEDMMASVIEEIANHQNLDEETIIQVFHSLVKFQNNISTQCSKSYVTFSRTIEGIIKSELETIFYKLLLKNHANVENQSLKITAVMLSWGIYGATIDWQRNSHLKPEKYIEFAMPYITKGMEFLVTEK